jgi:hypothetical protein
VKFDIYLSIGTEIRGISGKPGNVLYFKNAFDDFLALNDVLEDDGDKLDPDGFLLWHVPESPGSTASSRWEPGLGLRLRPRHVAQEVRREEAHDCHAA